MAPVAPAARVEADDESESHDATFFSKISKVQVEKERARAEAHGENRWTKTASFLVEKMVILMDF